MQIENKEVYFYMYCNTCKFEDLDEIEDPCHDCINMPMNKESHKPLYFEEKTK